MPGPLRRFLGSFNGPQTLGNSAFFWICLAIGLVFLVTLPEWASRFRILNTSNIMISIMLALSLCLIWGYAGILSLGQAAFYVIGGYAYGVVGINLLESHGNTHVALLAGLIVPALFAAVIGALMFYSRLKGVYVAILLLVMSLLLGLFMRQTADPSYTIGGAYLGGMNGLRGATSSDPSIPSLIFGFGENVAEFDGRRAPFYYLVLGILVVVYLFLRWLVNSSFGYVLVGVREDPDRTETLGYDVRLVQLGVFVLAAALAGLSGALYTAWGEYIHPDAFNVGPNILVVIWVAIGGRKDLTSVIVSTFALSWISLELTSLGASSLFVLGMLLVISMMVAPEGVVYSSGAFIGAQLRRLWRRFRRPVPPLAVPQPSRGEP